MKVQVTKRSECSEVDEKKHAKESVVRKVKEVGVKWIRRFLVSMLLRPSTWRCLIVHIPEAWDKAEGKIKQLIAWFTDLN